MKPKQCTKCGMCEPDVTFHKNQSRCTLCRAEYSIEYRRKNKIRIARQQAEYQRRNSDAVSDAYVKRLLLTQLCITVAEVTPKMIEIKRKQILLHREFKKIKNRLRERTE